MSISRPALGVASDVQGDIACLPATLEVAGEEMFEGALLDIEVCRSGAGGSDTAAGGASRGPSDDLPFGRVVQCSSTRCNRSRIVDRASSVVLWLGKNGDSANYPSRIPSWRDDGGGGGAYDRRSVRVLVTFLLTL